MSLVKERYMLGLPIYGGTEKHTPFVEGTPARRPSPLDKYEPPKTLGKKTVNPEHIQKLGNQILEEVMDEHYPETQELLKKLRKLRGGSHA